MIKIDTNLYLLYSMFNISSKKLTGEYSGMSIEKIMEAEAAQGNAAAADFDKEVLTDPVKLIELFQLKDPNNKFAILSNLNEQDLEELLPLLDKKEMIVGLNLFTKDKLLDLTEKLPPEQLVKFALDMFPPEKLISKMPEEQLNKALMSTDLDKDMVLRLLPSLKPEILAQMIEAATGKPISVPQRQSHGGHLEINSKELTQQLAALPDDKFKEAMINMPPVTKQGFILMLTQEDPKLFELFDADAYTNIIGQREKEDIIKSAHVIEDEQLVKMLEELPQDLTAMVMTQIDTNKFAEILIKDYKDVLGQIVLA